MANLLFQIFHRSIKRYDKYKKSFKSFSWNMKDKLLTIHTFTAYIQNDLIISPSRKQLLHHRYVSMTRTI